MTKLECALSGSLVHPRPEAPLLSVVVPTFNRPSELLETVTSLGDQLRDGLEAKVELVISDNGSSPETIDAIKALANHYPALSYVLNARNEGGFFNFFAAPWRAQGRYTWVFGSDDLLLQGGIANVVTLLERDKPSFMTLNKQVVDATLSQSFWESTHAVPGRKFSSFIELFCALGINQLAFISGQIELTETARKLDPEPYLRTDSRHPHVAAYLEKHAHTSAYYCAENHLIHRNDNSPMLEYHAGNFFDYGVTFPILLMQVAEKVGAPKNLLERITGLKRVSDFKKPEVTFVDSMFENLLRALAAGRHISVGQRRTLEAMLSQHCREDRLEQFRQIFDYGQRLYQLELEETAAKAALAQARQAALQTSAVFTKPTGG